MSTIVAGHLHVIQWLNERNFSWNSCARLATSAEQWHILAWFIENQHAKGEVLACVCVDPRITELVKS